MAILKSESFKPTPYDNALLDAVKAGDIGAVKFNLIDRKANIEARDELGNTALHLAAQNDHRDIIDLLVTNKANIEAKNYNGWTPLHAACNKGSGNEVTVALLLAYNADIEAQDKSGQTPLFHATSYFGKEKVVKLLLERGANYKATDFKGTTPIKEAEKNGNPALARFIITSHQKLKKEAKLAPAKIEELESRVRQLEDQIKQLMLQAQQPQRNNPDNNSSRTKNPTFFSKSEDKGAPDETYGQGAGGPGQPGMGQ